MEFKYKCTQMHSVFKIVPFGRETLMHVGPAVARWHADPKF